MASSKKKPRPRPYGRSQAPADQEPAEDTPPEDKPDPVREKLTAAEQRAKAAEAKLKQLEREKLGAEERAKLELEEARGKLAEYEAAEQKRVAKDRQGKFASEVAKLAPDVPARRLRALLREAADEDGLDIAPEVASTVLAKRALEAIKEIDPDSFKPKDPGNAPPVPGVGGLSQRGPMSARERGARAAGRK